MEIIRKLVLQAKLLIVGALVIYSIVLVTIEWRTSQDYVRNFFTDITGPTPFYAINTSVSVGLLAAAALLFAVCMRCHELSQGFTLRWWFYLSQVIIFSELAFDDRFEVHEKLSYRTGIGDHWFLFVSAVAQLVAVLLCLGVRFLVTTASGRWLIAGGVFFVGMSIIDIFGPDKGFLRLSLEDLAKSAGALCIAFYGWEMFNAELAQLQDKSSAKTESL